jgi:anaerobic selenocysteine-containing dehydrogenase
MLPCITGSWKEVGGGFLLSLSGAFPLNDDAIKRADLMKTALGREARTINMVELGKVLNEEKNPPVKALFVYNSNPATVCPNHNEVVRGLLRPDLFTVVHEQFMTDTTDYADIVLPATTFFEHKDLQKSYGHYYLQISQQAIAPLGECRPNVDVFRELALRMGFEEDCFRESVDEMIDAALDSSDPWLDGISRERLESEPHVRLNFFDAKEGGDGADATPAQAPRPFLPFAKGNFRTASGKAELYSEALKAQGLDPVAAFTAPEESRHGRCIDQKFPLELLARKSDNFLNSTFSNISSVREMRRTGGPWRAK